MSEESRRRTGGVEEAQAGMRLDLWLVQADGGLSRTRAQKLIEEGRVKVDGRVRPARHRLKAGEWVEWEHPQARPTGLRSQDEVEFSIVYEDEDVAVIDKPAGLVVHPAPGHHDGTLVNGLVARLDGLSEVGGVQRPGLVHRLDRDTSGLLVVAKNDAAHQALSAQLQDHSLHRVYQAICWGHPAPADGEIEAPLDRHPTDRKRRSVVSSGKPAHTRYWTEEVLEGAARLRLRLTTGRTHQIRVHLAHRGHPVLGDGLYGGGEKRLKGADPRHRPALKAALAALGRQALHAAELAFRHPASGRPVSFRSALPEDFEAALDLLRGGGGGAPGVDRGTGDS